MLSISKNQSGTQVVLSFVKHEQLPYGTQQLSFPMNALGLDTDTNLIRIFTTGNNTAVAYAYVDEMVIDGVTPTMDNVNALFADVACSQSSGGGSGEGCDCEDVIAGVEDEISGITADMETLESEVSAATQTVQTLSGNVSTLSGSVSTLSSSVSSLSGDVETISGDVETLSGEVSTLSDDVAGISSAIPDLADQISANTDSISTLSSSIPTAVSDLTNDEGFLTQEDFKTINNQSIVGSGNIDIQGTGSGYTIQRLTQSQYDALPSSAKTDATIMYVITDANSDYYTKSEVDDLISGATSDVETLSGDVSTLSSSVQSVSGNVNTLSGNVSTISGNVSTLSGTVSANTSSISTLSGDTSSLQEQVDAMVLPTFEWDSTTQTLNIYYDDGSGDGEAI